MGKEKDLSEDFGQRVVRAYIEGKGYKAISEQFKVPVTTVDSGVRKYKTFNTVKNLSGRGMKRKESTKLARKTCRDANNNPRITTKALIDALDKAETKV